MPSLPIQVNKAVVQQAIDQYASLLITGRYMPLLMAVLDTETMTIQTVATKEFVQGLRQDEQAQERTISDLRDSLGRIVAGPAYR